MASIFTQIIAGELPAHFVWSDDLVVAFLDVNPKTDGHTLVIPRREVDQWTSMTEDEAERVFWAARQIARAQLNEFECTRIGLLIAGYHVPHVHAHVFPTTGMADLDFTSLGAPAEPDHLEQVAMRLRAALARHGHAEFAVTAVGG